MPSIEESLSGKVDLTTYEPHTPQSSPVLDSEMSSVRSTFLRCPVPPIGAVSPDNLDQYGLRGLVPQFRVFIGKQ